MVHGRSRNHSFGLRDLPLVTRHSALDLFGSLFALLRQRVPQAVMNPPFVVFDDAGPIVATAIHAGHDLRPEVEDLIAVDEETRRREEDPYTDVLTAAAPVRVIVNRSRFEVDLNRSRDKAVYQLPEDAWGLQLWKGELSRDLQAGSLRIYDSFYKAIGSILDRLDTRGRFLVVDIHSYNHRRKGANAPPSAPEDNPDVNIGTGSLDRSRWGGLVDRFANDLASALPAKCTVAENVRFKGGYFSTWVNEQYAERGCALALEFKKTFMDEWSGTLDESHLGRLTEALAATLHGLSSELGSHLGSTS